MSHSDHFGLHGPSSEDHFDNWIEPWDPWETPGERRRNRKWDETKRASATRYYEQVNLYSVAVDSHKLRGDLKTAITKTNEWLARNKTIGYPDSPVNIFINFFKKEVRQDRTIDKVIKANTVDLRVDYEKACVTHLSFYDTYWPSYAMGFYRDLTAVTKQLDFEALRSSNADTTSEGVVMSASVKELMGNSLSRLANFSFT